MADSLSSDPSSGHSLQVQYFNPLQSSTSAPSPPNFSLSAGANTDIWHKPSPLASSPPHSAFNAPILHYLLPLSKLKSARLTLASAPWSTLYDQAGLILYLKKPAEGTPRRWVKAGIEFYEGKPRGSVVVCDRWADWSVGTEMSGDGIEIEFRREIRPGGERGSALLVFVGRKGVVGEKVPLREVTWLVAGDEDLEQEVWLGAYAARPDKDAEDELLVQFKGFELELF